MNLLSFDTETHLIKPGCQAPPMVCASFALDAAEPWLLLREEALDYVADALGNPAFHFVGQNIAYDFAVVAAERPDLLPAIFAAYDADRVHDIRVRDMMLLNARGELQEEHGRIEFTLEAIARRRFGADLSGDKKGPDSWRLRFAELDGVPLEQWPEEAVRYVLDDARWPLRVYQEQEDENDALIEGINTEMTGRGALIDEPGQTRAAFALHLMACWGILTDEQSVNALEARLLETVGAAREKLIASGILKGKGKKNKDTGVIGVDWAKDTKKIKDLVLRALGPDAPRTDPSNTYPDGQVKTDEETLRETGDADLLVLADVMGDEKLLTTYVQALKGRIKRGNTKEYDQRGLYLPGRGWLIQSSPNVLVASGRTSWSKPNLQNPPKKGGVRECFIPRDGHWFLSVDYSFIEMVCWAQTCLDIPEIGRSTLAEAIIAGKDPHCLLARNLLAAEGHEHTYEEVVAGKKTWAKDARTASKAGNFGLMGGMGPDTFSETSRKEGLDISPDRARVLKTAWMGTWEEAWAYFAYVNGMASFGSDARVVVLPRTGFVRTCEKYTAACNTFFQGLAARGAKEAMWNVAKSCYDSGALAGCRPVVFLHDELILEVPAHRERAHEAALALQQLMEDGMRKFVPDVPVKTEPTLMDRWYKEAEPVWGKDGVLELWRPKA